jgi:uncharacterized protein (DUF58 family)
VSVSSMEDLLALRGAAQGLRLQARKLTRMAHAGSHLSTQRGRGLEFQEVRPYVNGDDPRTIDWRVTARRGKPHTKLFREERERPVWLLADLNRSMFFGTRRQLKSTVVVRAAALLAWSAALAGDRVGAVVAGSSECRIIPPRAREAGVLPALGALLEMQPEGPGPASDALTAGLAALAPLIHPGSLVLVLSDYASLDTNPNAPDGDCAARWAALAVHNEFRLFWVTDPLERQALPNGRFRIGIPGRTVSVDGAAIRGAWVEKWRTREARIQQLATTLHAPVTQLDTSESVEDVLRILLSGRRTAA